MKGAMMRIIPQQSYPVLLALWCACWTCACTSTAEKTAPAREFKHAGVTLTLEQCTNVARDFHCLLNISTDNPETLVDIGGKANLTDNNGNQYPVNYTKIDDNPLNIHPNRISRIKIIASRSIQYQLIFHNIADKSAQMRTLELTFTVQSPARSGQQFATFQIVS